jgi:hypothetical protein
VAEVVEVSIKLFRVPEFLDAAELMFLLVKGDERYAYFHYVLLMLSLPSLFR